MYDPLDFAQGIEQLAQAESLGDMGHRKIILELMLTRLETVGGNLADELTDYVATLSLFDDPVNFDKLGALHAELAALWGSSTGYRLEKRIEGTRKPRRQDVNDWIAKAIKKYPAKSRPELWDIAPDWITDQIGQGRFEKRVSQVRKQIRK